MSFHHVFLRIAACLLAIGVAGAAIADDLPAPTGTVILTISGSITNTNVGDTAQFDRQMLADMGMRDISTGTPWHDGVVTFSGVPLGTLMRRVGANGETINAVALNDYEADIPLSDAWDTDVILAMQQDGHDLTVREKGPLFVIYPYDSASAFHSQTYYARSAWQVTRLVIR